MWLKHLNSIQNVIWMDTSPERTYRWAVDIWKDAQRHYSSERCKLKPQWDITSHQSECLPKSTNNKCWRGCGEKGTLVHCWWECRWVQLIRKTVWTFLKKLEMELPYDPAVPLLGIYLKKPKTLIQKNICTSMIIAALFTVAKIWKQTKCPSVDECIKKAVVHLHKGILLSWKNEENLTFCNRMDGPGEYYAVWNRPVRERQVPYDFTYMSNVMNKIN